MEKIINIADSFYKINNVQVKGKKSKLLIFNGSTKLKLRQIEVSGSMVQEKKPIAIICFLGVWLTSNLRKKYVFGKTKAVITLVATSLRFKKLTISQIIYINNL